MKSSIQEFVNVEFWVLLSFGCFWVLLNSIAFSESHRRLSKVSHQIKRKRTLLLAKREMVFVLTQENAYL